MEKNFLPENFLLSTDPANSACKHRRQSPPDPAPDCSL